MKSSGVKLSPASVPLGVIGRGARWVKPMGLTARRRPDICFTVVWALAPSIICSNGNVQRKQKIFNLLIFSMQILDQRITLS